VVRIALNLALEGLSRARMSDCDEQLIALEGRDVLDFDRGKFGAPQALEDDGVPDGPHATCAAVRRRRADDLSDGSMPRIAKCG
jgi:hypothetical protein